MLSEKSKWKKLGNLNDVVIIDELCNVVATFKNLKSASNYLNINYGTLEYAIIRKSKVKRKYFICRMYMMMNMFNIVKSKNEIKKRKNKLKHQSVFQFDLHGNFIQEFYNKTTASNETGISISSISANCNNKVKTAGKFKWSNERHPIWEFNII